MILSAKLVTAIALSLVVCILPVDIDSAVLTPMRIAHPAVRGLQLRAGIPRSLAQVNRVRILVPEEALLILDSRPGIEGTWLHVESLKRGDRGWVASWLVVPAVVATSSARATRYRLGSLLFEWASAFLRSYYGYVLPWTWTLAEQVIASIVAAILLRWCLWFRRRRRP
jgi:hypothetical protein